MSPSSHHCREPGLDQGTSSRRAGRETATPGRPASGLVASLLELQRTVGNAAVTALLRQEGNGEGAVQRTRATATAHVQRLPTGLAAEEPTTAFAAQAYGYWSGADNRDDSFQDLSVYLVAQANDQLPTPKVRCGLEYRESGNRGEFNPATWMIEVNTAKFSERTGVSSVAQLTKEEMAGVVNTIYHEVRHCEQYFRIARMHVGQKKTENKTVNDIVKEITTGMSIPRRVAMEAVASPLSNATNEDRELTEEAKGWEQITVGKYVRYRQAIQGLRDPSEKMIAVLDSHEYNPSAKITKIAPFITQIDACMSGPLSEETQKIERMERKDRFDQAVVEHIKKIGSAFGDLKTAFSGQTADATSEQAITKLRALAYAVWKADRAAYLDFEHEKDAWAVGDRAATAFQALVTEKEQPKAEEAAAEAEEEPADEVEDEQPPTSFDLGQLKTGLDFGQLSTTLAQWHVGDEELTDEDDATHDEAEEVEADLSS